jgi:hypothetical protein
LSQPAAACPSLRGKSYLLGKCPALLVIRLQTLAVTG